jgi:hypothetical protein
MMALANRAVGHTALAILDILRADSGNEPLADARAEGIGLFLPRQLLLGQREFGRLFVRCSTNPLAVFVE